MHARPKLRGYLVLTRLERDGRHGDPRAAAVCGDAAAAHGAAAGLQRRGGPPVSSRLRLVLGVLFAHVF